MSKSEIIKKVAEELGVECHESKMRCVERGTFDQPFKTEQPTVQESAVDTIALDSFCRSRGYNQGYVEYENDIHKTYCVKSNQIMERAFFQPNN